ncbi:MAG: arylesterase [Gammaproteobacteria bacterium]|nr:arylesterase [Gammaproteobacteria bacterium]MBI5618968.1 arylesterase [Gammaproteobacteria bacterium]
MGVLTRIFVLICFACSIGLGTARAAEVKPALLVFGDSLSAGYGIDVARAWPALLQRRIDDAGLGYRVVNASISGETTAGGLARLPALLDAERPRVVFVELGANDGLRGLPLAAIKENLASLLGMIHDRGAVAILTRMEVPPNYGPAYTRAYARLFGEFAVPGRVEIAPFILQDVALKPELLQADGLHPREEAQVMLLDAVWPTIEGVLRTAAGAAAR